MNIELLKKYINNKCSSAEVNLIIKWLKEEADCISNHRMVREIWHEPVQIYNHYEDEKFELILDKIHHKINLLKPKKQKSTGNSIQQINKIFIRIAAVLFIPLLLAFLFILHTSRSEIQELTRKGSDNIDVISPIGSRTYIELPDGTKVHLNHGSKLSYPRRFIGKERNVELSGEAYFTVAHNPGKPFRVDVNHAIITATGTEFNVMAYPGQQNIETTLVKGKIVFQDSKKMEPGEHLSYSIKTGHYICDKTDILKYISWKDGVLIFKDDPLEEIAFKLSRWYNVDFIFKDNSVKDIPYTATFVDETLVQILDLLQLATPIKYEITPRIKQPNGIFSKQKVIINSL